MKVRKPEVGLWLGVLGAILTLCLSGCFRACLTVDQVETSTVVQKTSSNAFMDIVKMIALPKEETK